jgi:hypothetical protein
VALASGLNVHPPAIAVELHTAVNESKEGVISSQTNVSTREKFRAALAQDDIAGDDGLAAKFLYTKALACAVASILDASLSLFMSHSLIIR